MEYLNQSYVLLLSVASFLLVMDQHCQLIFVFELSSPEPHFVDAAQIDCKTTRYRVPIVPTTAAHAQLILETSTFVPISQAKKE